MPEKQEPLPLVTDIKVMLKSLHFLIIKAKPQFKDNKPIGYLVPVREFDRVRTKLHRISRVLSVKRGGARRG